MVFPTAVGPAELAEVRRRVDRPAMVVDMPQHGFADASGAGAAIVLYYGFAAITQFAALKQALEALKAGQAPAYRAQVAAFEDFLGYEEFTERSRKYRGPG
jgi:hypothetical protein